MSASEAPRLYAAKDIRKLQIEFETHKEENIAAINILLDRIEALETAQ